MTKIQYSIDVKAKQVCVEPRPSTLYVTLSEFAAGGLLLSAGAVSRYRSNTHILYSAMSE